MHEDVRNIRRTILGLHHPKTLRTERYLSRSWRMGGRLNEAMALSEELLERALAVFGHNHYDTREAAQALWRCLIQQRLVDEADDLQNDYGLALTINDQSSRDKALRRLSVSAPL